MGNLLVHIGHPKTGSTLLQKNIFSNKNFNFINANSHKAILKLFLLARSYDINDFKKKTIDLNIAIYDNKLNIISYEFITIDQYNFKHDSVITIKNIIQFFKTKFPKIKIQLLIIQREISELLFSMYHEDLSIFMFYNFKNYSYKNFVRSLNDNKSNPLLENFGDSYLNRLRIIFGNKIICLSYAELKNDLNHFISAINNILNSNFILSDFEKKINQSNTKHNFTYHKKKPYFINLFRLIYWFYLTFTPKTYKASFFTIKRFFYNLLVALFFIFRDKNYNKYDYKKLIYKKIEENNHK